MKSIKTIQGILGLILLTLMLCFSTNTVEAQILNTKFEISEGEYTEFKIFHELIPFVEEFIEDAHRYNLDISKLHQVEGIHLAGLDTRDDTQRLGYTGKYYDKYLVFINFRIEDPKLLKIILYHEMSHVLFYDIDIHCKGLRCPGLANPGGKKRVDGILKNWNKSVRKYMKYLKRNEKRLNKNND